MARERVATRERGESRLTGDGERLRGHRKNDVQARGQVSKIRKRKDNVMVGRGTFSCRWDVR